MRLGKLERGPPPLKPSDTPRAGHARAERLAPGIAIAGAGPWADIRRMVPAPSSDSSTVPVPVADPGREYAELREELETALLEVAASGSYVLGPAVERFEAEVAEYLGVAHAVGVGSGTDALLLALRALGVGAGDEVITSPFTFFATAGAIVHAGATPVFADILPDTFDLDPEAAEAAVTSRTVALLPVHLFGQMADMERLGAVAERHGLAVVEDAAQAIGAWQEGSSGRVGAGAAGNAGCFSFYPTKNLGGLGDGGLVTTDDPELAERVRRLRVHGRAGGGYRHLEVGYNSRLDALQAAALRVKLGRLEEWTERRRANAAAYDEVLGERDDEGTLLPPAVRPGNRHVFHQYTVRCGDRDATAAGLEAHGIGHAVYYPVPLHRQEALAHLGHREGDFPAAERAARQVLSVPVFPGLRAEERERVAAALRAVAEGGETGAETLDPSEGAD